MEIGSHPLSTPLVASQRSDTKSCPGKERLDLNQIDFRPDVRDRHYEAETAAGVKMFMSRSDGPALGRR